MGITNSKSEKDAALCLCRERKRFIEQAIDSRYALAASHVSYTSSLRTIGIALRRYAEAEALIESSLCNSDKTPSHSSYPSPSPPSPKVSGSSLHNERPVSPGGAATTTLSFMRSGGGGGGGGVTMRFNPVSSSYVDEENSIPLPPPPPDSCWDYFDPIDAEESESFRFVGSGGVDVSCEDIKGWRTMRRSEGGDHSSGERCSEFDDGAKIEVSGDLVAQKGSEERNVGRLSEEGVDGEGRELVMVRGNGNEEGRRERSVGEKDLTDEREDPSEFITHRAKDFVSSIKDIESRFFRASESGREVSRMLESNKIRVGYSDAKGRSSRLALLGTFQLVCCRGKSSLVSSEPENVTKVITWKRTTSSRSSSSRNPLAGASKDDGDDSGSDFIEEFCMIAGSHSSTLDRLYAWERKLYDEVKASECIRKVYDVKCDQLRNQFAKDCSSQIIDKTRAMVKDLHSRITVALHAVNSISKRIEKMRDDELLPQLFELNQGLTRMWKAMLECHHAQYITISLAYHSKSSTVTCQGDGLRTCQGDGLRQLMAQLLEEIECFGLSFANWINSLTSYVEALNGWLQHCIIQTQERTKSKRAIFSPRRVVAPPIFVLFRDWAAGIRGLPSTEVTDAVQAFITDLRQLMEQASTQRRQQKATADVNDRESESKGDEEHKDDENSDESSSNLSCIHASLTKVLDRLTKFSEASLKMYEDIRQKSEAARNAYSNCVMPLRN